MRITKKGQTTLLFSCLISTLSISALQAEPSLPPVAEVKLNEAPPPWAARPDAQVADYSDQDENIAQTQNAPADTDLNATMPLPVAMPVLNSSESAPLTLEDNNSLDDQQAETPKKQIKKKPTLMSKLFSRKKEKKYHQAEPNRAGIEQWYQNRNGNLQATASAENLEAQAAQGDSDAQYQLGLMYRSGTGVEENVYQAIHWLTRAANADNSQAQYALAMIFRENATQTQDEKKALSWLRRAAQNGHANAQYTLGLLYANGDSVQQNSGLAKKWFKLSAEQGNMAAKIAFAASENAPTPTSKMASVAPVEIPIELSDVDTATKPMIEENKTQVTELSTPSQTHFVTTPNKQAAPAVQNLAKNQVVEEPQEQIRVASVTAPMPPLRENTNEDLTPQNSTQNQATSTSISPSSIENSVSSNLGSAIDTASIRQAAMAGDAKSQLLYGSLYEDGKGGLEQNYKEAVFWYKKAADQGYAQAQYNLGLLYEDGRGIDQDYYEASQWYKRASNNGFSEAQNNLGVLYITGRGVIKDRNRAELMFRRASEQGNANAERNLKMLLQNDS